jgi:hypothetical protein
MSVRLPWVFLISKKLTKATFPFWLLPLVAYIEQYFAQVRIWGLKNNTNFLLTLPYFLFALISVLAWFKWLIVITWNCMYTQMSCYSLFLIIIWMTKILRNTVLYLLWTCTWLKRKTHLFSRFAFFPSWIRFIFLFSHCQYLLIKFSFS